MWIKKLEIKIKKGVIPWVWMKEEKVSGRREVDGREEKRKSAAKMT